VPFVRLLPTLVGFVCVRHGHKTSHEEKTTCKEIGLRALAPIKGLQKARDHPAAVMGDRVTVERVNGIMNDRVDFLAIHFLLSRARTQLPETQL
jgi:hypothetical protein